MSFDKSKFTEKKYTKHGVQSLFFDFDICQFGEKKLKTKKFDYHDTILLFLQENPEFKIHFTQDSGLTNFKKDNTDLYVNIDHFISYCDKLGSERKKRAFAFFGKDIKLENLINLTDEQKDEFIKTNATEKNMIEAIKKLDEAAQSNVYLALQQNQSADIPKENIVICDANKAQIFKQLLQEKNSEEFWQMLSKDSPEIALKLSLGHLQSERKKVLAEFSTSITNAELKESFWQDFFEKNKWIFGYGLKYQILRQETSQPHYGGTNVEGTGEQKGDYLCSTDGDIGFTVLVEIKMPSTKLLSGTSAQRNGAWSLSSALTDGITQLQANKAKWEIEGSRTDANRDTLEKNQKYTIAPKGILLIGKLEEIASDRDKRATFERFRREIGAVEILTFDELLKRAEFIVSADEPDKEIPEETTLSNT